MLDTFLLLTLGLAVTLLVIHTIQEAREPR
jgi:hypothetical protein